MRIKKSTLIGIILVIIIIIFLWNSLLVPKPPVGNYQPVEGSSFYSIGDSVCADNQGRPYVFMFSTTFCSHCTWIKDTFKSLENEFPNEINLQIWELDTGDNPLTFPVEDRVPTEFRNIFNKYSPQGSVPAFVFGCEYLRIGTGYERTKDLNAELEDFKLVINKLLE
jgi:thiol-disulfide isomerase/thioredoxin